LGRTLSFEVLDFAKSKLRIDFDPQLALGNPARVKRRQLGEE